MKKSHILPAFFASALLVPTGAFANYYSYQACIEAGGSFFSCMGELLWDNGEIATPDIQEEFGFVKEFDEERILETVKMLSPDCDQGKGEERMVCYQDGLKKYLLEE